MAVPIGSGERLRRRQAVNHPSGGYVLLGVMIGIALLGIGLSGAGALWSQVLKRDREAELVFRGEAVARAIERYQRDRPGSLPETLEELVEGRYLRRAWSDPMTGQPFVLLRAEDAASPPALPGPPPPVPNPAGATAEPARAQRSAARSETGSGGREGLETRGIVGVASTSPELSFRVYRGARRYQDWRFEAAVRAQGSGRSNRAR